MECIVHVSYAIIIKNRITMLENTSNLLPSIWLFKQHKPWSIQFTLVVWGPNLPLSYHIMFTSMSTDNSSKVRSHANVKEIFVEDCAEAKAVENNEYKMVPPHECFIFEVVDPRPVSNLLLRSFVLIQWMKILKTKNKWPENYLYYNDIFVTKIFQTFRSDSSVKAHVQCFQ